MKISYIGNFEPEFSTENDVRKAFEYLGHEIIKLQENKISIGDIRSAVFGGSDLLLITSTWDDALPLTDFNRLDPKIAISGMLSLFKDMAKINIPSATLHLDTFWGTSRGGRKWWLNPMFYTSIIFTADGDYQKEWQLMGKNHVWLPPAVRHDAVKIGRKRPEFECDVAFVGSNGEGYHEDVWTYRKELLQNLREICKRNNWSFRNPGGDEPKIERDDTLNDFYASAKVVVGDSLCLKKTESKYWSDRVPETTGRGGFLLMPMITELNKIYPKMPMYRWGDWDMLENEIDYWLRNGELREKIKEEMFEETKKNHTYVNRVQTILEGMNAKS